MPVCLPFPFHADAAPRVRSSPVDARYLYISRPYASSRPRDTVTLFSLLRPFSRAAPPEPLQCFPKCLAALTGCAEREPRGFRSSAEARTTARSIFRAKGPRPSMRPAKSGLRWRYGNARRVDAARPRKGRMSPPRERPTTPPPRKMYPVPSNDAPSMRRPMSHPSVKLPSHALYQMIAPDINAGT